MRYDTQIGSGFHRWHEGHYTPAQKLAMSDFTHSSILNSGSYRSGKTEGMCRMGLRHAIAFPNAKVGVFRQFQASLKISTMLTFLQLTHPSWVKDWSNSELTLTLKNNATVRFLGLDSSDKIGSIELTQALLDEAHEIDEESDTMVNGRLSGELKIPANFDGLPPDLQAYVKGTADLRQSLYACNPKSKGHRLYKNFIESPGEGRIAYMSNSLANPNLPASYLPSQLEQYLLDSQSHDRAWLLEQIRQVRDGEVDPSGVHLAPYLSVFGQRNLLGQWVSADGAIWNINPETHFTEEPMRDAVGVIAGVDFGFANPRIVLARYNQAGHYQTFGYWHEQQSTPGELVIKMTEFALQMPIDYIFVPPDQPGIIRELKLSLEQVGIDTGIVKGAKNSVLAGINSVASSLGKHELTFLKAPMLFRNEMTGYEWKPGKDEPLKVNDHYCDAIRYLVFSHKYRNRQL